MIIEHDVKAIIMLTKCFELRKDGTKQRKCEQYWPETIGECLQYGHMKITTLNIENPDGGDIIIRTLEVHSKFIIFLMKGVVFLFSEGVVL